ncbi:MAG: tRNA (adenosine(37)-N6)-threonylcarbamoyltransferase complex dimerization subunit type 1 TsaB [Candidatus Limnocylindria bacterium]
MIVAIESSSTDLSIAVADLTGETGNVDGWSGGHRHARELLPRLVSLVERRGDRLGDAGAVVIGTGPGSFTGLRVGMGVAKGIALAVGCSIFGVPSLAAWLIAEPHAEAAIGRAGVAEAYLLLRDGQAPSVVGFDELRAERFGSVVAPADLIAQLGLSHGVPPFRAGDGLVREGVRRMSEASSGDDVETLEPAYLRPPRRTEAHDGGREAEHRGTVGCA